MLTIRPAQLKALSASVTERLIDDAVEIVHASLPDVYDQMGRAEVRESVHLAVRKSEEYGLESWSDIVRYLSVMYILGFEFDEDPRYGWAQSTLAGELPAEAKMDRVTELAIRESETAHSSPRA